MFLHLAAAAVAYLSSLVIPHHAVLMKPIPNTSFVASHIRHTPATHISKPVTTTNALVATEASAPAVLTSAPTPPATPTPSSLPPTPTPLPITPTPTLAPSTTSSSDLDTLFTTYSETYHADKNLLEKIANCESSFNPNASYLDYLGMFQFSPDSWSSTRNTMGLDPNPDLRTNAEESIKTAAYMIGNGNQNAWPSCEK